MLPRLEQARVLDCGLGTGLFGRAMVKAAGLPGKIYGVDLAPRMLAEARRRLEGARVEPRLVSADIGALPFGCGAFDIVLSAHALEHLTDLAAGVREIRRVLRPGGRAVLVVTRRGLMGRLVALQFGNRCFDPVEISTAMHAAGFVDVTLGQLGTARWWRLSTLTCVGRVAGTAAESRAVAASGSRSRPRARLTLMERPPAGG